MTPKPVDVHPAAIREAKNARRWYQRRSEDAGIRFSAELNSAFDKIQTHPLIYAGYLRGTRRYLLPRFPYLVVYRILSDRIQIVAVAHGRRRPGYWRSRK